jgi:hypothetical protein
MKTANAELINFINAFICFFLSSLFCGICHPKFWNFLCNRKEFNPAGELLGRFKDAQLNKAATSRQSINLMSPAELALSQKPTALGGDQLQDPSKVCARMR